MVKSDKAKSSDVESWLRKAANDIRGAEVDLAANPPLLEDAAFHCQQAIEKCLKGFLAWHDQPFRKTHDLVELGRKCSDINPSLEPLLKSVAPLTEFAWAFRYPGESPEPERGEIESALRLAKEVATTVRKQLHLG